jgi:hypothetical protein
MVLRCTRRQTAGNRKWLLLDLPELIYTRLAHASTSAVDDRRHGGPPVDTIGCSHERHRLSFSLLNKLMLPLWHTGFSSCMHSGCPVDPL